MPHNMCYKTSAEKHIFIFLDGVVFNISAWIVFPWAYCRLGPCVLARVAERSVARRSATVYEGALASFWCDAWEQQVALRERWPPGPRDDRPLVLVGCYGEVYHFADVGHRYRGTTDLWCLVLVNGCGEVYR